MKSLQLTKAAIVKPAIIAISIYYIILVAFLILAVSTGSNDGYTSRTTPVFLFIFALIQVVYMFKFSQNVCVSRKTCFVAAVYTMLAMAIITVILDSLFMLLGKLTGTMINTYVELNTLFEVLVAISEYIVIIAWGMLIGIAWYRLSKFVRICIGVTSGILFFMGIPLLVAFSYKIGRNNEEFFLLLQKISYSIHELFAARDIWTILVNLVIATVVTGIFYLVIKRAQITELK